jgi:hypothetical protein
LIYRNYAYGLWSGYLKVKGLDKYLV